MHLEGVWEHRTNYKFACCCACQLRGDFKRCWKCNTFERLGVPYVFIGAFSGQAYGVTRLTVDVDIVVDLTKDHIRAMASTYPSPRFYADPQQMRDSIRLGIIFNVIDSSEGRKVDLIPVTMKPGYGFALKNRIRRPVPAKEPFEAWFARPDDAVVGKLMARKADAD
jgi:hypothetical protein